MGAPGRPETPQRRGRGQGDESAPWPPGREGQGTSRRALAMAATAKWRPACNRRPQEETVLRHGGGVDRADTAPHPADPLDAQDGRERPLAWCPQERAEWPVPLQHRRADEPDPRGADPQGGGGPPAHVPPVPDVGGQCVPRDLGGGGRRDRDTHTPGPRRRLLGALPLAVPLQGGDPVVVPLGLQGPLLSRMRSAGAPPWCPGSVRIVDRGAMLRRKKGRRAEGVGYLGADPLSRSGLLEPAAAADSRPREPARVPGRR